MKRYPLNQSQLYKVTSPEVLAKRISIDLSELEDIANRDDNYRHFKVGEGKKRAVQEPKKRLRKIHSKIKDWLSRIETPGYLHSAVRNRSYLSNARVHSAETNSIKTDIRAFFPSVSKHAVYLFFSKTMKCRRDVAMLLAKLLTVNNHLPTGSPVSTILSYFVHKTMFDEIARLAENLNLSFSVYVDDMCLSGDKAVRATLFRVRGIIARHGLKSHKCRFFPAGISRVVTGVALTERGIRLPNKRHLKIKRAFEEFNKMPESIEREKAILSLRSRLHEAAQLEPKWAERARSFTAAHAKRK